MPSRLSYSWLTSLGHSWFDRTPVRTARTRSRRLTIEGLEDRLVPSLATLSSALVGPEGVAVDASGNLYIAQIGDANGNPAAIKELVKSSNTLTTLVSSGIGFPAGVAVDGNGNVYIADLANQAIEEWVASTQTFTTLISSGTAAWQPCRRRGRWQRQPVHR